MNADGTWTVALTVGEFATLDRAFRMYAHDYQARGLPW